MENQLLRLVFFLSVLHFKYKNNYNIIMYS